MRNIEARLTQIERESAKSQTVEVEFKNRESAKMPLLQAVQLLISGRVRTITMPWKSEAEIREFQTGVIGEIEAYVFNQIKKRREKEADN